MNAHNALAKPVTYKSLIHFVLPCIAMMIITSVYSIVDGFFVSNAAEKPDINRHNSSGYDTAVGNQRWFYSRYFCRL